MPKKRVFKYVCLCNHGKLETTEMSYIPEDRASDALQNLKYHHSPKFGRDFLLGAKVYVTIK